MSFGHPSTTEGVIVMKTWKSILDYETDARRNQTSSEPPPITSQYELIKHIYALDRDLGKTVVDFHMLKHPVAMEKQRALFGFQPGLFSLLINVTMNSAHPFRYYNEFISVRNLLDKKFPTIAYTFDEVCEWGRQLDAALLRFLHFVLVYEYDSAPIVPESIQPPNYYIGINPVLYSPAAVAASRLISPPPPIFRIGADITNLNGILVHGVVGPDQEKLIVEVAAAHKYFIARKIQIVKSLESSPRFTVGMYNVMVKVKQSPFISIGYRINDEDSHNIPEAGIDFSHIIPVVCIDPECRQDVNCANSMREYKFIYIKTSSVNLGDAPMAARNTIDLEAMRSTWMRNALMNNLEVPVICDPLAIENERRLRFHKIKGVDCTFRMIWEEAYLRFILREFRKKSKEDDELIAAHIMPRPGENDHPDLHIRLDEGSGHAVTLFMPNIYQRL